MSFDVSFLTTRERDFLASLSDGEVELLSQGIADPRVEKGLVEIDFVETPVPPEVFFSEKYFIGERVWNPITKTGLYPRWKEELCYVLNPSNGITEWVLGGALGSGKTLISVLACLYWFYLLTCLRDPHTYLGLMAEEDIEFFFFSVSLGAAEDTALDRFERFINTSPYFREKFPENRRRKPQGQSLTGGREEKVYKLEYPPYFSVIGGSGAQHQIGRNILCFLLDEANFVQRSKKDAGRYTYSELSHAYVMYTELRDRVNSRFMQMGRVPGLGMLVSSAGSEFDFLELHKKKIAPQVGKNVHVTEFSRWEVSPFKYSDQTFRVFVGGKTANSRLLQDEEEVPPGVDGRVIEVPLDFKAPFDSDLAKALRNIGGVPSDTMTPLIPVRSQVAATFHPDRKHPFKLESPSVGHMSGQSLTDLLLLEELVKWKGKFLHPRFFPESPRHAHIDLGKTRDAAGIAMGTVVNTRVSKGVDGKPILVPIIWIDFMLRVVPPRAPEQIGFAAIRELLLYLFTELHFRPGAISYDGFESTESMQIIQDNLKANPILWAATKARKKLPRYPVVGHLSVDKHSAPYESLRSAVMEARMISYEYAPYLQEIVLLQRDPESGKVDHLPSMSKDVSDAVAGVCFHCSEQIKSSDVEVAEAQKHGSLSPPLKGGGPALPWSVADYKVYDNDD